MKSVTGYILAATFILSAACSRVPERNDGLKIAVLRGPSAVQAVRLIDSLSRNPEGRWSVSMYDEPLRLRTEMIDGAVDFAVLPTTMAALLYNKGVDYRLVAVPVWGSLYLCGTDSTCHDIRNLRGQRVNVMGRGTAPDVLFRHILDGNGLNPDRDLTLDYSFPAHVDLANAAMAGRTRLCLLPEPFVSLAAAGGSGLTVLADMAEEWRKLHGMPLAETSLLCRGNLSEADTSAVRELLGAYLRSSEWVVSHPDSAAALAVGYGIAADSSALCASIPRSRFNVIRAEDAEKEIDFYLEVFLNSYPDAIGNRMPDEKFIVR